MVDPVRAARLREQVTAILDKLDSVDDSKFRNRRSGARCPFRRDDVQVLVSHPGGSTILRTVSTRNLSASGLGFLYNSFLHTGTRVEVVLKRHIGGDEDRIRGKVVFCAHVSGQFHQVGVRFDSKIFPRLYADDGQADRGAPGGAAAAAAAAAMHAAASRDAQRPEKPLAGSVLLVDDQSFDRTLMEHHLKDTQVKLTTAPDHRQGVRAVQTLAFDLVLCELNLEASTGECTIQSLRKAGHRGPICIVTAERAPARLEAAARAGAVGVLYKPYDQPQLFAFLAKHLKPADTKDALTSTLPDSPETSGPLANYVAAVKGLAAEIRDAAARGDVDRMRQMCMTLRASGTTYGFARLYEAACEAIRTLDAANGVEKSLNEVLSLADLCSRVVVKK